MELLSLMIVIVVKEKSPFRLSGPQAVSHACGFWRIQKGSHRGRGGMVKVQAGARTLFMSSCGSWEGVKPCPIQRFFPLSVRFCTHTQEGNTLWQERKEKSYPYCQSWLVDPPERATSAWCYSTPSSASCNEFHAPLHTS